MTGEKRLRLPSGTRRTMLPPPAVILGTPVVPAEGGDAPSRRHSRHPSRPRRRRGCPLPPSFSAPQSSPPKAGMPPPAVILPALVPAEGGDAPSRRHSRHPSRPRRRRDDWGGGNPVALASSTYCRFTSARLAPAPVRIKEGGDAPPAIRIKVGGDPVKKSIAFSLSLSALFRAAAVIFFHRPTPPAVILPALVPAEGGNWGGGNPVALASSTYCRFTSARLAPAPSGLKQAGMPLPPSFSAPQSSTPKAGRLGCRESSGSCK